MHRLATLPAWLPLIVLLGSFFVFAPPGPSHAHEPAQTEVDEISKRLEEQPSAHDYLRRGELHRIEGRYEQALHDYAHAEALDSTLQEITLCRGALFLDTGETDKALGELDSYLTANPSSDRALRLRARAWAVLGEPIKAVRDWDRAIEYAKRATPDHYYERAKLLATLGDEATVEALTGLDQGIERLGAVVSLVFMAIDLEVQLGRYDEALERLESIEPQFARKEIVLERRGRILLAAGRRTEARGAFVAALSELESLPTHRRSTRAVEALEARLNEVLAELLADDAEDGK